MDNVISQSSESHRLSKLIAIGAVVNILEWYDFSVYAFLAVVIGQLFFDVSNPQIALINAFFIFSISYLVRPLGSLVFGYLGDTYGRRFALRLSFMLMAIPTGLIGLLPTYHNIGLFAVVLMVCLRLLQGFAAGGELPGSACYMYEASPKKNKNFFCCFVSTSSMSGVLLGSFVVWMLHNCFSEEVILAWAWRLPFLFGFIVAIIIFHIRNSITETLTAPIDGSQSSLIQRMREHKQSITTVVVLNIFVSVTLYTLFIWMPSYLIVFLDIPAQQAHLFGTVGLAVLIISTLIIGYYAERIGQRRLLLFGISAVMLLTYPMFLLLNTQSFAVILTTLIVMGIMFSSIEAVLMAVMGSLFKSHVRFTGISLSFTLPTAIFGGLAPTVASYLIHATGNTMVPALLPIMASMIALPVMMRLEATQKSVLSVET